jgi:hypothetical protein
MIKKQVVGVQDGFSILYDVFILLRDLLFFLEVIVLILHRNFVADSELVVTGFEFFQI